MMGESKAQSSYHWHEMQLEHTVWYTEVVGRHQNDQLKLLGVYLFEAFDDGDMFGQGLLQIVSTLVADFHQQGSRFAIDESKDTFIHIVIAGDGPVESFSKRVECPKSHEVALGGDDLASAQDGSNISRQIVGTAYVSGEYGDGIHSHAVDTHHGRVGVLVFDIRCDGSYTDAHGSDKYKGIVVLPLLTHQLSADDCRTEFALE